MTTSKAKKMQKRLEHVESVAIGMGFLLLKLRTRYGDDFGVGMSEQVDQAIADYQQISKQRANEIKQKAAVTQLGEVK